jgi:hypothetical protein
MVVKTQIYVLPQKLKSFEKNSINESSLPIDNFALTILSQVIRTSTKKYVFFNFCGKTVFSMPKTALDQK